MKAFTLIEMLVVTVVIAALVAWSTPALMGAREAARAQVCASNLKQIDLATEAYRAERWAWPIYASELDQARELRCPVTLEDSNLNDYRVYAELHASNLLRYPFLRDNEHRVRQLVGEYMELAPVLAEDFRLQSGHRSRLRPHHNVLFPDHSVKRTK